MEYYAYYVVYNLIITYDIIGFDLQYRRFWTVLANRMYDITYDIIYNMVKTHDIIVKGTVRRIRHHRFSYYVVYDMREQCLYYTMSFVMLRCRTCISPVTYDVYVYVRRLTLYRDVLHLAWSRTVTVTQPLSASLSRAVGALAIRQCQNNVIRDVSTNCVSQ